MAKRVATQRAEPIAQAPQWRVAAVDVARTAAIVAMVVAFVALLWFARTALLLLFAGMLLAVLLDGMSRPLMRWTGMPKGAALSLVVLGIGLFFVLVAVSAGPVLLEQLEELGRNLAQTITSLGQEAATQAGQSGMLRNFDWSALIELLPSPLGIATGATAVAGTVLGAITSILIVIFFGVYLALTPSLYVTLVLRFVPAERRAEIRGVLDEIGTVLHNWLRGQLLAMTIVGVVTYFGLLILDIPLAFVLALLLGMFEFIPYIGPILGAAPMLLVSAGQGFDMLVWAFALYLVVQLLESYVITPIIQSRAVSLPPVVVILSQLVFGAMFGVLGLALATPLVAAVSVPVRRYLGADIRT
jgi:predicted PurR-regulated permease PerM